MSDTGAGTPLTAEEAQIADFLKRLRHVDRDILVWIRDVLAERDELRAARPATDPAGLDVERLRTAYNNILVRPGIGWPPKRSEWDEIAAEYERLARLSVADGPGPEERLVRVARALLAAAQPDDDFEGQYVEFLVPFEAIEELRAALPVEETGRS